VTKPANLPKSFVLETPRLALRPLDEEDLAPFAAMHADARFMQYLAAPLSHAESAAALSRLRASYDDVGFGPWAVELREQPGLIGVVGLSRSQLEVSFAPCVEVVWRLAPAQWGRGYATEAARASLDYGFKVLRLLEILAWTTPANQASRRVMEKLGMTRDPSEDFDHPRLPGGHPLTRHVLYRARAVD
jgi:ribosomal-protein-alanine N-acetyltransferase